MAGKYPLNGTHYTEADDLEMLSHPDDWPPGYLFVKRGSPATEFGVVENIGTMRAIHGTASSTGKEWSYPDAQSMVADGWRVD